MRVVQFVCDSCGKVADEETAKWWFSYRATDSFRIGFFSPRRKSYACSDACATKPMLAYLHRHDKRWGRPSATEAIPESTK